MPAQWMLQNKHASVALLDMVHSPEDDNLVIAAVVAASTVELIRAIKAQMEKNGGNGLTAVNVKSFQDNTLHLRGAGRGYIYVPQPLSKVHANGAVAVFLHKAASDPRLGDPEAPFYVVTESDDPGAVTAAFVERLRVASRQTVLPEWGDYLLQEGERLSLVTGLTLTGSGRFFKAALRVERKDNTWADIIGLGLREGHISLMLN